MCVYIYIYIHTYIMISIQHFIYSSRPFLFSSVQSLSRVHFFVTPRTAAPQASMSITNSQKALKPIPLSQWCHPRVSSSVIPFSSCSQSFPASGSFQLISSSHHVAKYGSFSFNISSSNEHPALISIRMDCLDLLAFQGALKNLLQYSSSKASILSFQLSL